MFNNDVTRTYNFQDASQEILIMLLGAFLLGCLLTWLLSKLFNKEYNVENSVYRYDNSDVDDEINLLKQTHPQQANTTSDVRIVKNPTKQQAKVVTSPDDLTKISGIDSSLVKELKKYDIKSYADLRDIKNTELKSIQNSQKINKREIETWPHQASLAAKGDWTKLSDYQGFIQRVQVASDVSNQEAKPENTDDLTKLEGISPELENILNKKDIYTYKQLSHIDNETLKNHIVNANSNYENQETESWPHQAAMAEKEQWDELKIYQDFMHSDSEENINKTTVSQASSTEDDTNSSHEPGSASNISKLKMKEETTLESIENSANENLDDHDDLKKIEGIGPKIEEVLNNGGIYTYSQLYNSNSDRLQELLNDAGSQYRMHNPDSWPHQAGMANRSEWNELKSYQNSLIQEQAEKARKASSKNVTKKATKKSKKSNVLSKKDDLRKIEGIGPKIQELLNNAGIETFKDLSKKSRDSIKKLLNEAGPQFRMHEPETWPHQAKLAANGDWKELEVYQDFLNGGRE